MKQLRKRLTYSNVMSSIAVFLVLGGATAFAAGLAKNSVGSKQIKKNAVTEVKIKDGAVSAGKLGEGSVVTGKLADGSVVTGKIVSSAVNSDKLANNSVVTIKLANGAVTSAKLTDLSVTNAKIANDAVTAPKIASGAVGADELNTVHEHFGPATNISDTTEHDGAYAAATATVSCAAGEDLLSVSVDWTNTGGHNERSFVGVNSISRGTTDSATVEVNYDGGAAVATFQPVATCIA